MDTDPILNEIDPVSFKYLCENRELYMLMSEMTRDGRVPPLSEVKEEAARRRHMNKCPANEQLARVDASFDGLEALARSIIAKGYSDGIFPDRRKEVRE